uniref:Uncharacterized protein n=1 Tax=Rhizophora mucronata TaxID=61149 RepID=A0A2P2PDL0_RHIMU
MMYSWFQMSKSFTIHVQSIIPDKA